MLIFWGNNVNKKYYSVLTNTLIYNAYNLVPNSVLTPAI